MSRECHHEASEDTDRRDSGPPVPGKEPLAWMESLARTFGEDSDTRWGKRLVRLASDMVLVCDDDLNILYHNRSFLRGVGYQAGSFVGTSLYSFFPENDLSDAEAAFGRLLSGRSAGMRIQATFLTHKGRRQFDARVTRSRRGKEAFYLYFVIRDETQRAEELAALQEKAVEPLFTGLPVAAFRTDRQLRITQAFGELWKEAFHCNLKSLIGVDLSDIGCPKAPKFLHQIDYCDTMAGLTLHTDFFFEGVCYEVTVEPFLNERKKKKVIGTVGMIRVAKTVTPRVESETLPFPTAKDATSPLRKPRTLAITADNLEEEIGRIRDSIRPRRITAEDFDREGEEDLVALSN